MLKKDIEKDLKIGKNKGIDLKDVQKAEKGIGFKSKDQILKALSPQMGDMKVMVKPTLKLSKKALETPLPGGWLSDVRDFLTRSGKWADHPIRSIEHFVSIPAPGVMVDRDLLPNVIGNIKEPVFISLGFGDMSFINNFRCGKNNCTDQWNGDETYGCTTNDCGKQSCTEFSCGENDCGEHGCGKNNCGKQRGITDFISDLEANWHHPFVQDLMDHFNVTTVEPLALTVQHFVCKNGFDESLLR